MSMFFFLRGAERKQKAAQAINKASAEKNAGASARSAKNNTALLHCCNVRVNKVAEDCRAAPRQRQNKRQQTLSNVEKASVERGV